MSQNNAPPSFEKLLDSARQSAYHLEMRDVYGVADEADNFAHWQRTGERDTDPASPYWAAREDTDDPAVAELCATAFAAVWARGVPHDTYGV
ncbi:DUF6879 family protein [Streptomyces sp. NPDC058657]|uniref:DUF6879 family protein n=1 Tax=unclassified Streptomyces TaxID=2593676 RepID=UPI00365E15AE